MVGFSVKKRKIFIELYTIKVVRKAFKTHIPMTRNIKKRNVSLGAICYFKK